MIRVVPKLLLAAALLATALPAAAAAGPAQVHGDCEDGHLQGSYTLKELRRALDTLPSDLDEYSDCRPALNAAIADAAGKSGGGDGGSPSAGGAGGDGGGTVDGGTLSGEEQAARETDAEALAAITSDPEGGPIEVGGEPVEPGENGVFDVASAENGMPAPLVWLLAALGVVALGGLVLLGGRRVPALGRATSSLKRISLPRGLPRLRRR